MVTMDGQLMVGWIEMTVADGSKDFAVELVVAPRSREIMEHA